MFTAMKAMPDSRLPEAGTSSILVRGKNLFTMRRWTNNGILKAYRLGPRGDRRFKRTDINRLFQHNTVRIAALGRIMS